MKLFWIILIVVVNLFAISSLDIAIKSNKAMYSFNDMISEVQMTLISEDGESDIKRLEVKYLHSQNGDKYLMTFLYPLELKDTKLLTYEHLVFNGKYSYIKDDEQWLYMPKQNRIKRISSNERSVSFVGSEFNYDDIAKQHYAKYKFIGDAIEEKYNDIDCYKIKRVPLNVKSSYSQNIVWIDKENFLIRKIDYYNINGELFKTAIVDNYKQDDKHWYIGRIYMQNHQNNKKTIIDWDFNKIKVNLNLTDDDFKTSILRD